MSRKKLYLALLAFWVFLVCLQIEMYCIVIFLEAQSREPIGSVIKQSPYSISIDRSQPFDPVKFTNFGDDWNIIEEQDKQSLTLTELDLNKVHFVDCLKDGEDNIKGEERLSRLKKMGAIRLDVKILQTLLKNQKLIPENWKQLYICFDGTVIRDPNGGRCILYMYWEDDRWNWQCNWLHSDYFINSPSAVFRN